MMPIGSQHAETSHGKSEHASLHFDSARYLGGRGQGRPQPALSLYPRPPFPLPLLPSPRPSPAPAFPVPRQDHEMSQSTQHQGLY